MEKHSVGQTIAALRKKKGWTQVELAEKLQVSDKAVSKWEKDDSYPSIEFLPVLASLFGVTIDYLITGATSDLGYELIRTVAKDGDKFLLQGFGDSSVLENFCAENKIDYTYYDVNLSDSEATDKFVNDIKELSYEKK